MYRDCGGDPDNVTSNGFDKQVSQVAGLFACSFPSLTMTFRDVGDVVEDVHVSV